MEVIPGIAALVTLAVKPLKVVSKHVIYPFRVSRNISSLKSAIERLSALKSAAQTRFTNGQRQNEEPTKEINNWLDEVETIEEKVRKVQEKHEHQHRCLWDICPNPWSNYKVSRSAAQKQVEVNKLCDRREKIKEVTVFMPPPLAPMLPMASSGDSPYLESALRDIKDGAHNIIGIWGMGGVGKTHLLKQLHNKLSRDGAFNVVVSVTCSKECSVEKVQMELIDKLGLPKNAGDTEDIRQSKIHNFLNKKNFVLLLDDLWSRVDLQTVGIPPVNEVAPDDCKRKVVLTTRSMHVCRLMGVHYPIKVNVLDPNAAWNLFKETANGNIESNPVVRKYATEVVEQLGGLPLALITIGGALSKTTDPSVWKYDLDLLKKARLDEVERPETTEEPLFKQLKFSYDKLRNDNLRECFLHCSLWPEDYEIEKSAIVELWMGLGLMDEDDIHSTYNTGYRYIRELQAVCLLEEATNKEFAVKLHDVIRDMSLWIVSKQHIEKNKWIVVSDIAAKDSKEIFIHQKTEKIQAMPWRDKISFSDTDCANITTLMINGHNNYQLDLLKKLKHHSFSNLTVLNLSYNGLNGVPIVICSIITLQFIDLSGNDINSLPIEPGDLIKLKHLLLRRNRIHTVPVGTILKIEALQVLDLTPDRSGYPGSRLDDELAFAPLLLDELQSLPIFGALGIEIDERVQLHKPSVLSKVPVRWLTVSTTKELSTFSFSPCFHGISQSRSNVVYLRINYMELENLIFQCPCKYPSSCQLESLEELRIFCVTVKEILWKGLEPKTFFPLLKCLTLYRCEKLTNISWVVHLPCLEELDVNQCFVIKQLFMGREQNEPTFPSLKFLRLAWNYKLESICDPEIVFPALECLIISQCTTLRKLPFRSDNISPKLNIIIRDGEWYWNILEWEDSNLKSLLYGFVKFT